MKEGQKITRFEIIKETDEQIIANLKQMIAIERGRNKEMQLVLENKLI